MKNLMTALVLVMATGFAANAFAANSCTIAQVMKTVHQNPAYSGYEYASNYEGKQGAPTQKQHENDDQYLFWVDNNGQTCPAVATYPSGVCAEGTAVVKTGSCE